MRKQGLQDRVATDFAALLGDVVLFADPILEGMTHESRWEPVGARPSAMYHANTLYNAAYGSAPALQETFQKAQRDVEVLQAEAQTQVLRKRMPGDRLKDLRPNIGYRNVGGNLFTLVQIFRANWENLEGKTSTTKEELDDAARVAESLTRMIGDRDGSPEEITAAADLQQRAFNRFLKVYSHVERALTFLRWNEGDVPLILPPIYTGKGPGKRKVGQKPEVTPPAQPAPAAAIGQHAAPASSGLPAGLPGGDPLEDAE